MAGMFRFKFISLIENVLFHVLELIPHPLLLKQEKGCRLILFFTIIYFGRVEFISRSLYKYKGAIMSMDWLSSGRAEELL